MICLNCGRKLNTKKADKLFTDIGCQSSKSTSVICYDDTVAYTTAYVKYSKKLIEDEL